MPSNILYLDVPYDGEPTIEAEVFGGRARLRVYRPTETSSVPEAEWRGCDAIVCYDTDIDAERIARLDRCRVIVRAGVGYDQISLAGCAKAGIPVCNTSDYGTTDVADHAIALMMGLARGVVAYDAALKADIGAGWDITVAPTVRRLTGQILGIVGLGRIGTATALRGKALGMQVVFYDPYRSTGTDMSLGLKRARTLDELLSVADVVSVHTPLSEETRKLIDRAAIARMKPGMLLINTARGPIVDPDAVLEGLRNGQLAGAALDVLPAEPPRGDERLLVAWRNNEPALAGRLILTPHAAFFSASSLADLRRKSSEVVSDYLYSDQLRNCVNGLDLPGAKRR